MRDIIITEIQRIAAANGQAPGQQLFESETGIAAHVWRGKFWARWGDALIDAGFEPNAWTSKSDANAIILGLIAAARHYGRFPTDSELSMLRNADQSVPSPKTVRSNFKARPEVIAAMNLFIAGNPDYADVLAMLPSAPTPRPTQSSGTKVVDGHVYLIKSGDFYKVGRSDQLERRVKEIRIALPDKAELVHAIRTDDPPGIEAYWHRRFADRRANGEWFKLTGPDVAAFRKRKFQ